MTKQLTGKYSWNRLFQQQYKLITLWSAKGQMAKSTCFVRTLISVVCIRKPTCILKKTSFGRT